jgi:hypothetical protein
MAQPESKLSREILSCLRARGIFAFKVHGGPTMMAGLPDIIACMPTVAEVDYGTYVDDAALGLFIGFETKTPSGGDPSAIQQRVHDNIKAAHGRVYVVRSVEDVLTALDDAGWSGIPDNPV